MVAQRMPTVTIDDNRAQIAAWLKEQGYDIEVATLMPLSADLADALVCLCDAAMRPGTIQGLEASMRILGRSRPADDLLALRKLALDAQMRAVR